MLHIRRPLSYRDLCPHGCVDKKYVVNVVTGDVRGAGTDANVFLIIFGDRGDSGERKLVKSETHRDKFERGQVSPLSGYTPAL